MKEDREIPLTEREKSALELIHKVEGKPYAKGGSDRIYILGQLYYDAPVQELTFSQVLGKWIHLI